MDQEDDERRLWFRSEVLPLEPLLRSRASRFCGGGSDDQHDLVHDTFIRLISCTGWREVANVRAFTLKTLKNLALQAISRRKVVRIEAVTDLELIEYADDLPGAERQLAARDELRLLAQVISELPPQCRRVFTLCKVYGQTHQQIADQLGLSIFTVEKHVSKGLRICSEQLAAARAPVLQPRNKGIRSPECGVSG